jgi:hypothetical protein
MIWRGFSIHVFVFVTVPHCSRSQRERYIWYPGGYRDETKGYGHRLARLSEIQPQCPPGRNAILELLSRMTEAHPTNDADWWHHEKCNTRSADFGRAIEMKGVKHRRVRFCQPPQGEPEPAASCEDFRALGLESCPWEIIVNDGPFRPAKPRGSAPNASKEVVSQPPGSAG